MPVPKNANSLELLFIVKAEAPLLNWMVPTLTPELSERLVVLDVPKIAKAFCALGTAEGKVQLPAVFQSLVPGLDVQVCACTLVVKQKIETVK